MRFLTLKDEKTLKEDENLVKHFFFIKIRNDRIIRIKTQSVYLYLEISLQLVKKVLMILIFSVISIEENFYNYLQKFLLSDGQLWENKYPRRHAEQRSLAEIKDYQGDLANRTFNANY